MSSIKGKQREALEDFGKKIGMVEVEVIAVNPTIEEFKEVLGRELDADSKLTEYLGESRDGNNYCRVDFWLKATEAGQTFKASFFLEDKVRTNQDGDKQQYINNIGVCSWAADPDTLPSWFAARDYRDAKGGEEDFYTFIRAWLGGLDYRDTDTELELDWKKLMKGNLDDLKDQIGGDFAVPFIAMATVAIKEVGDELKEYQGIYTRGFLPAFTMRHFTLIDYSDPAIIAKLAAKASKDLKVHERFVTNVTGDYGCKDIYSLKPLSEYIAEEHIVASDESMMGSTEENAEY